MSQHNEPKGSAGATPQRILVIWQREREVQGMDEMALLRSLLPPGFVLEVFEEDDSETPLANALMETDYVLGFTRWRRWSTREYDAAASVKLIQLMSAGYDRVDVSEAARIGVPVCQNGGANSTAVAEHSVLLLLAVLHKLVVLDRSVRAGAWIPPGGRGFPELEGKLVGVIGMGMIAKKFSRIMHGFEARVQYYKINRLAADEEAALGVSYVSLDELLGTSDVVSLHLPLTEQTRRMIGSRELGLMKPTAILVNTSRGGVVDEAALYRALVDGTLAGAGLDVFEHEPTPGDNPLLRLDNLVCTPHVAGASLENRGSKRFQTAFQNIQRVARGEPPLWLIPELRHLFTGVSNSTAPPTGLAGT